MDLPVKIKVIRKGELKEVKRIHISDIYLGECWLCRSKCLCVNMANGHTHHFIDKKQLALVECQK